MCAMQFMASSASDQNISPALRFVEVYSSPETYQPAEGGAAAAAVMTVIYTHLTQKDYFGCARSVCDARVPPLIEETTSAPTHHAQAALEMVARPLRVLYAAAGVGDAAIRQGIRDRGMANLVQRVFAQPYTEQVELFVIPALAAEPSFPFNHFCQVSQNYLHLKIDILKRQTLQFLCEKLQKKPLS